jgi:hypothetical protein
MGVAMDMAAGFVTNQVALTGVTVSPGDSLTVRNFDPPAFARLEAVIMKGGQSVTVRITSPMFHDVSRGLTFISAQAPTQVQLPQDIGQPLRAQDTLIMQLLSGAANSTMAVLQNYYSDLGGASARLHSWGDISGLIKSIKPIEVDCVSSATIGTWVDTGITATESLLHATTDYAILGYQVDVAVAAVAVRGQDTSNLRVGGPGSTLQDTTVDYFIDADSRHSGPHIPVFNSANAGSTVVSVIDNAASTAVKVQLICAELTQSVN